VFGVVVVVVVVVIVIAACCYSRDSIPVPDGTPDTGYCMQRWML
jgi:hypothetical protein